MDRTDPRAALCARLKTAREAKGVSLEEIAASTKIPASLFRGLESADLSRWPKGIFRRSYLRDYLRAVGLPPDPVVREFVRLFRDPDDSSATAASAAEPADDEPSLALMPGGDAIARMARARARIAAAALDAAMVLLASLAVVLGEHTDPAASLATVALAYYGVATACFGQSAGARWLDHRRVTQWKRRARAPRPAHRLSDHVRDLLARSAHPSFRRDLARVAWNAVLLRIWFFR